MLLMMMIMASILGCIFGCNLPEIKIHNFSLATHKGQNWKFSQRLPDAPAIIVLKFEAAEKQFEFELRRARVFGKNAVVRIVGGVSFYIHMCAITSDLIILLNIKKKKAK